MSLLDPIFNPLLEFNPLLIVLIISAIVCFIITIIYKLTTNQDLMKQLKEETKEFQKEMKELKEDPKKMMEVQKKAMKTNMRYMKHSMRSTLITFIPIILIFGWMNANIAYEPITPNQEFTVSVSLEKGVQGNVEIIAPEGIRVLTNTTKIVVDNEATWLLEGEEGEYVGENAIKFEFNDYSEYKDIIITNTQKFAPVLKNIKNSQIKRIEVNNNPMKVLNLFGWQIGWLGTYIIFSIVLSMLVRKILKVY